MDVRCRTLRDACLTPTSGISLLHNPCCVAQPETSEDCALSHPWYISSQYTGTVGPQGARVHSFAHRPSERSLSAHSPRKQGHQAPGSHLGVLVVDPKSS